MQSLWLDLKNHARPVKFTGSEKCEKTFKFSLPSPTMCNTECSLEKLRWQERRYRNLRCRSRHKHNWCVHSCQQRSVRACMCVCVLCAWCVSVCLCVGVCWYWFMWLYVLRLQYSLFQIVLQQAGLLSIKTLFRTNTVSKYIYINFNNLYVDAFSLLERTSKLTKLI